MLTLHKVVSYLSGMRSHQGWWLMVLLPHVHGPRWLRTALSAPKGRDCAMSFPFVPSTVSIVEKPARKLVHTGADTHEHTEKGKKLKIYITKAIFNACYIC